MGLYEQVIFPRLMDRMMSGPHLAPLRAEALSLAHGRVLELGFGTGLNLQHYPDTVTELVGVDTNPGMSSKAVPRIRASRFKVGLVTVDGRSLGFDSSSFDAVVTTWTLCSVAHVDQLLAEVRRVMKPEARLLVLEHGLADDPKVQKWQRRFNSINRVLACGCNLDRDIHNLIERNGFAFNHLKTFYMEKEPRVTGFTYLGDASATPASA